MDGWLDGWMDGWMFFLRPAYRTCSLLFCSVEKPSATTLPITLSAVVAVVSILTLATGVTVYKKKKGERLKLVMAVISPPVHCWV